MDGVCGPCDEGPDCGGQICENQACLDCNLGGVGLDPCIGQYGPDYECHPDGTCRPMTCLADSDCYLLGWICLDHVCSPCQDTFDCVPEEESGYPEGTSYAILLMNATVPLIDRYFPNRVFGTKEKVT